MNRRTGLRVSWSDRVLGYIPWALGAVFGAIAIHLLAVLAMPALSPNASYRTLAMHLALGQKEALPRPAATGDDKMLFADPFAALAICRYDLTQGPLRLLASTDGDRPFSVSVRLADGAIIYSGNDRQTPHGRFDILIVTQAQADERDATSKIGEEEAANDQLRLISPSAKGFAVFRALSLREGDFEEAAATQAGIECTVQKPEPKTN